MSDSGGFEAMVAGLGSDESSLSDRFLVAADRIGELIATDQGYDGKVVGYLLCADTVEPGDMDPTQFRFRFYPEENSVSRSARAGLACWLPHGTEQLLFRPTGDPTFLFKNLPDVSVGVEVAGRRMCSYVEELGDDFPGSKYKFDITEVTVE